MIQPIQYDEGWKMAFSFWLESSLHFFIPHIASKIDWQKEYVLLNDELQSISSEDNIARVDKLIRFTLLNNKSIFLLVHIEIQSHSPHLIAKRMFYYGLKIINLFPNNELISFILFIGDENYKNIHIYKPFQFSNSLTFISEYYKLAEHSEEELIKSNTEIGYALLLTKWINKEKKTMGKRVETLKRFITLVQSKSMTIENIKKLISFAEKMVPLSEDVKPEYKNYKQEKLNTMANIHVQPNWEAKLSKSIAYLIHSNKSFEEMLLQGKMEGEEKGILKGKLEGEQAGILKGEAKGKLENTYETAKKLKNLDVEYSIISQATGLSIQEIENL